MFTTARLRDIEPFLNSISATYYFGHNFCGLLFSHLYCNAEGNNSYLTMLLKQETESATQMTERSTIHTL